jgi:hypothetical protein
MTQYDDTQIGQFMQEALPKLIFHLDFLLANPDVKIHYGFTKQRILPSSVLPHIFFETVGLIDRLINGTCYAREAIMPREGGCQDIGYNAWENVYLRDRFLKLAGIEEDASFKVTNGQREKHKDKDKDKQGQTRTRTRTRTRTSPYSRQIHPERGADNKPYVAQRQHPRTVGCPKQSVRRA